MAGSRPAAEQALRPPPSRRVFGGRRRGSSTFSVGIAAGRGLMGLDSRRTRRTFASGNADRSRPYHQPGSAPPPHVRSTDQHGGPEPTIRSGRSRLKSDTRGRTTICALYVFDVSFLVAQTDPDLPSPEMLVTLTQGARGQNYEFKSPTFHVWTFEILFCVD